MHSPIWIFDNPRTCSQLLHRFFKPHPELDTKGCFQWATHASISGPERLQLRVNNGPRAYDADRKFQSEVIELYGSGLDITKETYEVATKRMIAGMELAQKNGKIPYIKDHVVCVLNHEVLAQLHHDRKVASPPHNPTIIPDNLYESIRSPIFQIRHPALAVPSWYRAQLDPFGNEAHEDAVEIWTMQRSVRFLYEHMRDQDKSPILIDAEDVVWNPETLCIKLAEILKTSPDGFGFEWETVPKERRKHPIQQPYCGTLEDSTGVIRPDKKTADVEIEQANWAREWGDDVANALRKLVDADMPDYLAMQEYRLRLD